MMKTLSRDEFEALIEGAQVLEQDRRGPKLYETASGKMVKLFRRKRFWSSDLICPFAVQFEKNAAALVAVGVPSIHVLRVAKVPHMQRQAVVYRKLPGSSLRSMLAGVSARRCNQLMARTAGFMADLQDRGVYFRSFHFGNILQLPDGRFGLIDVLGLKLRGRPLTTVERARNFRHLIRDRDDRDNLRRGWDGFFQAYTTGVVAGRSGISPRATRDLLEGVRRLL